MSKQPPQAGYPQVNYGAPGPEAGYNAQTHHTTVVVNQPMGGAAGGPQRDWSTGVFGCFEEMGICLMGCFCSCILACQLASDMGEFSCLCCCVPGWLTALRTKWRLQENIQGSICDDCICAQCCGVCTLCQLAREVKKKRDGML